MKFISLASLYTLGSHLISLEAQQQHISPRIVTRSGFLQIPPEQRKVWTRCSFTDAQRKFHLGTPTCGSCPPGPWGDETFMSSWPPGSASCSSGFFIQSRYPRHAQAFQVSTNAQPKDVIAAFMVKVILIWLSRQMDFKSVLLCVSASTAVAVFLGGKKNGCTLSSLETCILIKYTYSVFLNARKGRRKNTAARGREILLWASCRFVPSGCFAQILPQPWAKSWVRHVILPASCHPYRMWLGAKPGSLLSQRGFEVRLQGAGPCFVGKKQRHSVSCQA